MIIPRQLIRRMADRMQDLNIQPGLKRLRLIVMPDWPFQSLERIRIMRDLIPGRWLADVLEEAVGIEIGLYEFSAGGGGDYFG